VSRTAGGLVHRRLGQLRACAPLPRSRHLHLRPQVDLAVMQCKI
jgi:hypothetical protein